MTLKIDNAIEEIERASAGNKPKYANDIYLKNAIRYLQEIKSPSLTDDQQVVLDYLKNIYSDVYEDCTPLETMYLFGSRRAWNEESELTEKEEFQVLAAFAEWGMKEVAE